MQYIIPLYNLPLVASICIFIILTLWMPDSQPTPVVPLCPLVSGTKYPHNLLLNITFFDFFITIFDWDDSHDKVFKLLKETSLRRLGHKISYHVVCGAPLYIQSIPTDTAIYEKETNADVIDTLANLRLPILLQENGVFVILINFFSMTYYH